MSKPEQIPLQRHMSQDELHKRLKTLENDVKVLIADRTMQKIF